MRHHLWSRVKERQRDSRSRIMTKDKGIRSERARRPSYLLSGLLKCGTCGGGFSKISLSQYGCSTARNKGTCDNLLTVRRDELGSQGPGWPEGPADAPGTGHDLHRRVPQGSKSAEGRTRWTSRPNRARPREDRTRDSQSDRGDQGGRAWCRGKGRDGEFGSPANRSPRSVRSSTASHAATAPEPCRAIPSKGHESGRSAQ